MPKGIPVSKEVRMKLYEARAAGWSYTDIEKEFGISNDVASKIVSRMKKTQALATKPTKVDPKLPKSKKAKKAKVTKSPKNNVVSESFLDMVFGPAVKKKFDELSDKTEMGKAITDALAAAKDNKYLRWALEGERNGWVARLLKETTEEQ